MASLTVTSPIRFLRVARGIAQADLALACGISASLMSDIERGRSKPSPEIVTKLADALQCDPSAVAAKVLNLATVEQQPEVNRTH